MCPGKYIQERSERVGAGDFGNSFLRLLRSEQFDLYQDFAETSEPIFIEFFGQDRISARCGKETIAAVTASVGTGLKKGQPIAIGFAKRSRRLGYRPQRLFAAGVRRGAESFWSRIAGWPNFQMPRS